MKKVLGPYSLVVLSLLPAAFVRAQEATPREPGLTIRQTVQEVVLEVVVRDARGRVVKNLKPSDLEVYEDGVPQEIRSFKLVQGHDVMVGKSKVTTAVQPAAFANPLKAVNLVCIVFSNLDPYTKKYAVDAVREFLKSQLEPDTWVAVFNLDSTLSVLHPFTTNRGEVMDAANKAFTGTGVDFARVATAVLNASPNVASIEIAQSGNPEHGGTVAVAQKIIGGELNPRAITGADVSNSDGANIQRGDLAGQHRQFGGIEGMREMDQILAMIRQLGTLPGRKSVLLLSPGLATTGDPDLFKSMVDKANKANVTVYGIDVNGLSAEVDQSQASSTALSHAAAVSLTQGTRGGGNGAAQNMEKMRQGDYVNDAVRTTDTQASLRALSESTGGFLIGSTNDLRKPFQRILEDVDTHYEVIYKPSSDKYDGRLRSIGVKSQRADLSVDSRTGYFALPVLGSVSELAPFEMAGLAALNVHQPPHAFEFKAGAYQFRPNSANAQNDLVFEIPAGNLFAPGTPDTRPEIFVMGDRNPYRISVDQKTGWLYWGEVGPDANDDTLATRGPRGYDEINQARAAGNFGWPLFVANNQAYHEWDYAKGISGARSTAPPHAMTHATTPAPRFCRPRTARSSGIRTTIRRTSRRSAKAGVPRWRGRCIARHCSRRAVIARCRRTTTANCSSTTGSAAG